MIEVVFIGVLGVFFGAIGVLIVQELRAAYRPSESRSEVSA